MSTSPVLEPKDAPPRTTRTEQTPSGEQGELLRALLVVPALLGGFALLTMKSNSGCQQGEIGQILWGLYLSVVVPVACGAFLPYATLKAWMRDHPFFCLVWTAWMMVMAAMFLLLC